MVLYTLMHGRSVCNINNKCGENYPLMLKNHFLLFKLPHRQCNDKTKQKAPKQKIQIIVQAAETNNIFLWPKSPWWTSAHKLHKMKNVQPSAIDLQQLLYMASLCQ